MKKLLLIVLMLNLLLLCACANVSLDYTLTEDHQVRVDYDLSFDETEEDTSKYIEEIGAYWAKLGFELTKSSDEDALHGQMAIMLESSKAAAEQFASLITADETVFYDVSFSYTPSFETDEYSFLASVSLDDVIRQSKAQGISAGQVSEVLSGAANGRYSISVALPGEVVLTNADSIDNGICTWIIPFGESKQLQLQTKRINTENLDLYAALQDRAAANQTWLIASVAAAALLSLAAVLSVIIRRVRRNRASKVRVKQFR